MFLLITGPLSLSGQNVLLSTDPTLGEILTDAGGNTLYYFTRDAAADASACTGGCLTVWPVFYEATLTPGPGLDAADFGAFQRADGAMQTTYKGWPLYYFASDANPGDTNGEGVNNVWYVAKPDYAIMLMDNQLTGLDGVNYTGDYTPGDGQVQYFVDAYGRTLYIFVNDNFDQNNFTAPDFSNNGVWPIYGEALGALPSGLDAGLFNTIDVHGSPQLTYQGWPLYYFGSDGARGETKGVSVPSPGIWPVAVAGLDPAPTVGLVEIAELVDWAVYPNPFRERLQVELHLAQPARLTFTLFNHLGQSVLPVWERSFGAGDHVFPWEGLSTLSAGMYWLRLRDERGGTTLMSLLKQ